MAKETSSVTFGSRYPGLMVVLDPGGPRLVDGHWVPKMPFKGVTFSQGHYSTSDPEEIEALKKHLGFNKDFWIMTKPADQEKVNVGRPIEVASGVKGTHSTPKRK